VSHQTYFFVAKKQDHSFKYQGKLKALYFVAEKANIIVFKNTNKSTRMNTLNKNTSKLSSTTLCSKKENSPFKHQNSLKVIYFAKERTNSSSLQKHE